MGVVVYVVFHSWQSTTEPEFNEHNLRCLKKKVRILKDGEEQFVLSLYT